MCKTLIVFRVKTCEFTIRFGFKKFIGMIICFGSVFGCLLPADISHTLLVFSG